MSALIKMMPDAFTFNYAGQEGELVHLTFTPNPSFRSSSWQPGTPCNGRRIMDTRERPKARCRERSTD